MKAVLASVTIVVSGLLGAAFVATAAGSADANPRLIQLEIGDAVDVIDTRVACFAAKSSGKRGIGCVIWSKKSKPLAGSYSVGLAVDGTAALSRVKADGSLQSLFKQRRLAVAHTVHRVKVGQGFGLPAPDGDVLGCQVLNITSKDFAPIYRGVKVSCWLATATSPLPNRFGVSISDKMAGVFKFTSKGTVSTWGIVKQQPRG
jgi:hypothetical protein